MPTRREAVKAVVQVSSRTAGCGRRIQILVDEPGRDRMIARDTALQGLPYLRSGPM
jgi:hypothetical protein